MRRRKIGAVRELLAEKVKRLLTDAGIDFMPFDGDSLVPVSGYWKKQDVYRWESVGLCCRHEVTGRPMQMSVCGWSTMTECVRSKNLVLTEPDMPHMFEVDPA